MLKKVLIFVIILLNYSGFTQITVSQTGTVAQWVQNVLRGPGVSVSNVTYTGDAQAIGTFTTGNSTTNLGFGSGIILSSGKATDTPGPNNTGGKSTNTSGGSDVNLAQLINTTTSNIKDAAILEFDFIPVSDTVKFSYVFGSEEYDEYVGSSYNDVFGFFISGLNPYGGNYSNVNIALIPGTTTPVSINNVNNGSTNSGPCNNCAYYTHNNAQWLQYDGKTVVLTAWIKVIPCYTYHIKLAVADVGDEVYDSGVFLQANSFMSNAIVIDQSTSNTIDTSAIEGCNDAIITFKIPHPISTNTIINYITQGTAINGVDYTNVGSQITIPAGHDSVNLIIHPILDGITESYEFIRLIVNTSACTYDTVLIYIKDNSLTVPVLPNDTVLCDSSNLVIPVNTTGGYPPYSYLWSTGDTTIQINVSPSVTTTYTVQATDLCSNDSTVTMVIKVSKPDFDIYGDTICKGDMGTATVVPIGILNYSWNTGDITSTISVTPPLTTTYQVRISDTLGCYIDTFSQIFVNPLPVVSISNDTNICDGESLSLWAAGGNTYQWNTGDVTSSIQVQPSQSQTYTVTATDNNMCHKDSSVKVVVLPSPHAVIHSTSDTICRGSLAILTATGGDNFFWNTGVTSSTIDIKPPETTTYSVVASNVAVGIICSDTAVFTQGVKRCNRFYVPSAFSPNGDGINDNFGVVGIFENIDFYEILIFDRWGKLVFKSNDVHQQWNGRIEGQKPVGGVYTYIIHIQETYSELYELSGTVHLLL